ncbi:MAG TPA: MerR family transcriptional regulator [bacterium]|nr:MerR family transcriptional regulator [bacterium]
MRDLESPVLPRAIVSRLTGLSFGTLARWRASGIAPRRGRRGARALYSWDDVERLQRAAHLVRTRRLPLADVKRLLARRAPAASSPKWVVARPKPAPRRRRRVVAFALPRSATRRPRRRSRVRATSLTR